MSRKKQKLVSRMSVSKVRTLCKKYGYDYTQEGECFYIKVPAFNSVLYFSSAYTMGNWMHHHVAMDCHLSDEDYEKKHSLYYDD